MAFSNLSHCPPCDPNTMGSARRLPRTTLLAASHLNLALDDGELVSDIQEQSEQIQRKRLSKHVKHTKEVQRVLVRNIIGEDYFDVQHAYRHPHCCISNPSQGQTND